MFLVTSSTKLGQLQWNFHLTWILSLHYLVKREMFTLHRCYPCIETERNSRIYPISTVPSKFAKFESSWLQRVGILQEKVYKTCITDLDNWNSDWERRGPSWIIVIAAAIRQWRHEVCFVHLSCNISHNVINWIQIWLICRPQLRWDKSRSFSI